MSKFAQVAARAELHGYRLERGDASRCHGARTGFILWKYGVWKQYNTLNEVIRIIG